MEPTEGLNPDNGSQISTTSCATLAALTPSLIFMNASAVNILDHAHGMAGENLLNASGALKQGSDTIFSWWARYQDAKAEGKDAVNGTIGALLEDDGNLAINKAVDSAIRESPEIEISAYAPLAGLPAFLDLSKPLPLGILEINSKNLDSILPQQQVQVAVEPCILQPTISSIRATMSCSEIGTGAIQRIPRE